MAGPGPHPRNRHRGRYDFPRLVAACPALAPFLRRNPAGEPTVDFAGPRPVLNFGGQARELWCPGGETGFVGRMVAESAREPELCLWFTSLVARSASLPHLRAALRQAGAARVQVIPMGWGQKESRILAWSFAAKFNESGTLHSP